VSAGFRPHGGPALGLHRCYLNTYNQILISTALVHFSMWDGGHRSAIYFLGSSRFLLIAIHVGGNAEGEKLGLRCLDELL
jgi:hypothetical protein